MKAVADFLLLFVEQLPGEFLPGKAQVTDGGDEALAHGAAGRKAEGTVVTVVGGSTESLRNGLMGEVSGGDQVWDVGAEGPSRMPAFSQVHLDERTMLAAEPGKGMEGFDDAGALGPAAAGAGREADHSNRA